MYFLEADHCIPKVRGRKHKAWLQVCNWGSMAVSLLKHLIQFKRRLEIIVSLAVISSRWSLWSCLVSNWTSLLMFLYQWLSCSLRDLPDILKACLFTWSTSGNIYRSPADKANMMLLHLKVQTRSVNRYIDHLGEPLTLPGMKWPLMHCETLMMKSMHHSIFISLTSIVVKHWYTVRKFNGSKTQSYVLHNMTFILVTLAKPSH